MHEGHIGQSGCARERAGPRGAQIQIQKRSSLPHHAVVEQADERRARGRAGMGNGAATKEAGGGKEEEGGGAGLSTLSVTIGGKAPPDCADQTAVLPSSSHHASLSRHSLRRLPTPQKTKAFDVITSIFYSK